MGLIFTESPLDRAAHLRRDETLISAMLRTARILPVWMQQHLVDAAPHAVAVDHAAIAAHVDMDAAVTVFLGILGEIPWFALILPDSETPPALEGEFKQLTDVAAILPMDDAAMLAYARGLAVWHGNHKHCGRCGAATIVIDAGHARRCSACDYRTFPRTDPAIITLIEDSTGECCLLGRQSHWRAGQYSTIAGFVEPGESLEDAVKRESVEETGVPVTDVRYLTSQPWPFPQSLMLGCRARALSTEIKRIDGELEDCRWFSRAELRAFGQEGTPFADLKLPRGFSISRWLVESWRDETT